MPLQSRPNPSSKAEADRLADQLNIFAKLEEILDAVHQHRQETRDGFLGVNEQLSMLREELQALKQENARLRKRGASEDEVRGCSDQSSQHSLIKVFQHDATAFIHFVCCLVSSRALWPL